MLLQKRLKAYKIFHVIVDILLYSEFIYTFLRNITTFALINCVERTTIFERQ